VGDDANLPLLNLLAANDGLVEWVRSTEPIDFKLAAFLSKLGKRPVDNLSLATAPKEDFRLI
jgi:Ca-activated chloride channel family protein